PRDLRINRRAAAPGVFEFFQDHHACSLAKHEPVALQVERPGSFGWFAIVGREDREKIKNRQAEWMNHAMRAGREHNLAIAVADHFSRLADGLAAGRASGQA